MQTQHLGLQDLPGTDRLDVEGRVGRRRWEDYADALRSLHDVGVSDDIPVRIDDDPRADGLLPCDFCCVDVSMIFHRPVP